MNQDRIATLYRVAKRPGSVVEAFTLLAWDFSYEDLEEYAKTLPNPETLYLSWETQECLRRSEHGSQK